MSDTTATIDAGGTSGSLGPPPAAAPAREPFDPSQRLHELARELMRARNRLLMAEYLRLRRALR